MNDDPHDCSYSQHRSQDQPVRHHGAVGELDEARAALARLGAVAGQFQEGPKGKPAVAIGLLRERLGGVDWPPTVRAVALETSSLFRWLRSVVEGDGARTALDRAETAMRVLAVWAPALELRIGPADLQVGFEASDPHVPGKLQGTVRRLAAPELEGRLLDLGILLLEDPPPMVPRPREDQFEQVWCGGTKRELSRVQRGDRIEITMADNQDALSAAEAELLCLVPDDDSPVAVAWTYSGAAGLTTGRVLRKNWLHLLTCGSFSDALAFPADAAWLVGYFHHDEVFVARRKGEWVHRVSFEL